MYFINQTECFACLQDKFTFTLCVNLKFKLII